ncbi:hypothetical protein [Nannocystis pusilla]|uniref:hypothetical protein n=1 Tax=Nannocystis pusilla TaxID=889268 RepID=UPI003B783548
MHRRERFPQSCPGLLLGACVDVRDVRDVQAAQPQLDERFKKVLVLAAVDLEGSHRDDEVVPPEYGDQPR